MTSRAAPLLAGFTRTKIGRPISRTSITAQINARWDVNGNVAGLPDWLLTGLGILLQFPSQCLFYGTPSLLLVAAYPLAKRVTYYPQFVLGLTFSWGAIMGFPALGVDLLQNSAALTAAAVAVAPTVVVVITNPGVL